MFYSYRILPYGYLVTAPETTLKRVHAAAVAVLSEPHTDLEHISCVANRDHIERELADRAFMRELDNDRRVTA